MESTRESQRVSLRVGKLSRFKADLNNLSSPERRVPEMLS